MRTMFALELYLRHASATAVTYFQSHP